MGAWVARKNILARGSTYWDNRVDGANWRAITLFLAGRIMVDDVEVEVATWRKVSELDSTLNLNTEFDGVPTKTKR